MVVYININPSCILKAYRDFNKVYTEYLYELSNNVVKGNKVDNILYRIKRIENVLKTSVQKSRGTKHWIDIDCDVPNNNELILKLQKEFLTNKKIKSFVIDTKSGYHLLISRKDLNFNPQDLCTCIYNKFMEYLNDQNMEVIVNKNEMIPLPGTLQAGHLVRILGD